MFKISFKIRGFLFSEFEIKQLHYKTIIFPTNGYPIFRNTVIYPKISYYHSGDVKREVKALEDLKDTYYTEENIKQTKKRKRFSNNEVDKKINEFYEEHRKHEISKYSNIEELIKKVFEDKDYKMEYK